MTELISGSVSCSLYLVIDDVTAALLSDWLLKV